MRLTVAFDVDGSPATWSHWLAAPGVATASAGQLEALRSLLAPVVLDLTSACTHAGTTVVRVDLTRFPPLPLHLSAPPANNAGSWTGGQLAVGATVLHWLTARAGSGQDPLTFMPGFPDEWTDNHSTVNDTGYANAHSAADAYLNGLALTPGPAGGSTTLGVVHRSSGGAPLSVASFSPAVDVTISRRIGTLDRRRHL